MKRPTRIPPSNWREPLATRALTRGRVSLTKRAHRRRVDPVGLTQPKAEGFENFNEPLASLKCIDAAHPVQ
jgi:hypothetical protein